MEMEITMRLGETTTVTVRGEDQRELVEAAGQVQYQPVVQHDQELGRGRRGDRVGQVSRADVWSSGGHRLPSQ